MRRAVLMLAATGCLGLLLAIGDAQGENSRYGTGFFIHPNGFLLTNQHVIENAVEVLVVTSDGKKLPARVLKADAYKDLELIKVDAADVPSLALGRCGDGTVQDSVDRLGVRS